jgi:SAM-dependent methyltransferase
MGRWSRALGPGFVSWLRVPPAAKWLEVGCGTGSLTAAICELGRPGSVLACDCAADYVAYCREKLRYPWLAVVATAPDELPPGASGLDVVVSSLVLNFLPAPVEALARMRAACAPGGCVAACVWDYAEGMEFLRVFWDEATAVNPAARSLDEGSRFPLCRPDALRAAFVAAGLGAVEVAPLSVVTEFAGFGDFWAPLADGPGPAPTYVAALSETDRSRLAERLRTRLTGTGDGPIRLRARAWAARGRAR